MNGTIGLVAVWLSAFLVIQTTGAAEPRLAVDPAAIRLWSEVLEARGGWERLLTIQTVLVYDGAPGRKPQNVELWDRTGRYWRWSAPLVRHAATWVSAFRPECACACSLSLVGSEVHVNPSQTTDDELWRRDANLLLFLGEADTFRPMPVAVRRGEGKWSDADVLTLKANGQKIEVFADRSTHLMQRIYYPDSGYPDIVIRGYRDVNGILMPNAVKAVWLPFFKGHAVAHAYTLRVNVAPAPSAFECDPRLGATPESWHTP